VVEVTESYCWTTPTPRCDSSRNSTPIGVKLALDDLARVLINLLRSPVSRRSLEWTVVHGRTADFNSIDVASSKRSGTCRFTQHERYREGIERIDQLEALRDIGFEFARAILSGAVSAGECEVSLARDPFAHAGSKV